MSIIYLRMKLYHVIDILGRSRLVVKRLMYPSSSSGMNGSHMNIEPSPLSSLSRAGKLPYRRCPTQLIKSTVVFSRSPPFFFLPGQRHSDRLMAIEIDKERRQRLSAFSRICSTISRLVDDGPRFLVRMSLIKSPIYPLRKQDKSTILCS